MRTFGLSVLAITVSIGAPGLAMGASDASSDALALRQELAASVAGQKATADHSPSGGRVAADERAPLGSSDGAADAFAARSRAGQGIAFGRMAARSTSQTVRPIGASDAAEDAFAARARGEGGRLGSGAVARDRGTSEPGVSVELEGSGAGEP
jgi:hypothetical protein